MKRKLLSVFLVLILVLSLAPGASAAENAADILTKGGVIKLTSDLTLTGDVHIAKNTILDLNGHTITGRETLMGPRYNGDGLLMPGDFYECPALIIENGVTATIRNGTLDKVQIRNNGVAEALSDLRIDTPKVSQPIENNGEIRRISRCNITGAALGIVNYGDIDLIDNCDISTTVNNAITNSPYVSEYDVDGISTIGRINHCRIICTDPLLGVGIGCGDAKTGPMLIENSLLVGYSRGGIMHGGHSALTVSNCIVINLSEIESEEPDHTMAIRILDKDGTQLPHLENCTLIAQEHPCGSYDWTEQEIKETRSEKNEAGELVEVPFTRIEVEFTFYEHMDATNCTFIPLNEVGDINTYLAWEMEPAPPAQADDGLAHFTPVNTYTQGQFTDMPASYWGSANIAKAYELGLMKGSSADTFDLKGEVSLAQAITMAARLNSIYATGTESFSQGTVWYETYVDYALKNGIINTQYGNYDQAATRAQFAAILAAALPKSALEPQNTVSDGKIPDVPMSSESADAIYALYRAGILTGNDAAGTFVPGSSIDRASAAAIITRMADVSLRKSITLDK